MVEARAAAARVVVTEAEMAAEKEVGWEAEVRVVAMAEAMEEATAEEMGAVVTGVEATAVEGKVAAGRAVED